MSRLTRHPALLLALLSTAVWLAACGGNSSGQPDASVDVDSGPKNIGPETVTANVISQSSLTDMEAETHVAVGQNGFVAVAYNAISGMGSGKMGYRFSKDGAATWEAPAALASPNGGEASDPVIAVDSQDNFYLSFVGYKMDMQGNTSDMHVYVASAPAGSTQFTVVGTAGPAAPGVDYDKPWITVMPDDAIVVTYSTTSSGGVWAARSTDGGHHWTSAKIFEDGMSFQNLVFPCHPRQGNRLYATYVSSDGSIALRYSDDGGASWPAGNVLTVSSSTESVAYDDPTCAADGDHVWVVYGLSNDPMGQSAQSSQKLNSIRLMHSSDGGKTVGGRYSVHDSQAAAYFQHPYLALEDGGALDLVYYAGNADGDTHGSFRWARSPNGGQSFNPSVAVQPNVTFLVARDSPKWLGDYPGLWLWAGEVYTSFTNNTADYSHVGFAKFPVAQ